MHLIYRKTCRVCGSSALTEVINLGEQYLQGSFVKPDKENPPLRKIPTVLVRCDPSRDEKACGLLQLKHSVPQKILYSAYWYRSGTNETMRQHLKEISVESVDLVFNKKGRVLDIGCNDGTLLSYFPKEFIKYGIDPSDIVLEVNNKERIIKDTFPSQRLNRVCKGEKFDIIASIAMFYDLEQPIEFVRSLKKLLAPNGIWVFEMSYMPAMLKLNSYDTICHEHLEYYSLTVLEKILEACNMKIVKLSLNQINGGSIRCFATHSTNNKYLIEEQSEELSNLRHKEFDLKLDTDEPYLAFQQRIEKQKKELVALLNKFKADGKKIHVYGASTKGNTILQWCGINNSLIDYAADRNPDKHGAKTLGTDIPIISEKESREMKPDYYLVLPWHFKNEFLIREKESLNKGVGMIFPLPELHVVKK